MKKQVRVAAKFSRASRAATRRPVAAKKETTLELSADEVSHLEQIDRRCAQSERSWQLMTAPPPGDETWHHVEEHLLAREEQDPERRWKYFSK